MTTLTGRLVFIDQLSWSLSSLEHHQDQDIVITCEYLEQGHTIHHHQKKIAFWLASIRHFTQAMTTKGWQVHPLHFQTLQTPDDLIKQVKQCVKAHGLQKLVITQPNHHGLYEHIKTWEKILGIPIDIRPDARFLCDIDLFSEWAKDRRQLRMEYFYRMMRQQHHILMDGDKPVGGQWNFDADNRKPPHKDLTPPPFFGHQPDAITRATIEDVKQHFHHHYGDLEPFLFAVTHAQAQACLDHFIEERLPLFGTYQDAMLHDEPWMYHAHISFYLNNGLLLPKTCIDAAVKAYQNHHAPLNAVEGFIRQILGWREFIRGFYWHMMPTYENSNVFNATRSLPDFYWHGKTDMHCMQQCLKATKEQAYAHHIQRLMVLGNFALLAGIHPNDVNEWYWIVYADAYQWVELPNVTGMILFADGGKLASKPYAAGGNYIHKMSNYCQYCRYHVSKKVGEDACPFNYLYWDFLQRNRQHLANNPRVAMMYRTWDKMSSEKQEAIQSSSLAFFKRLEKDEKK